MKIAQIVESSSAGVGKHVIDLSEGLVKQGHSVHVIYSVGRIDKRFSEGIARLQELGASTYQMSMRHAPHPDDLGAIARIRRYLRANGPFDCVHCHSTKAGLLGRLASFRLGARVVYTPHAFLTMSSAISPGMRAGTRVLENGLALLNEHCICVSQVERDHALSLGLPSSKLEIVLNGIDLTNVEQIKAQRHDLRAHWGVGEDEVCVGFVGRLFTQKAPEVALTAFLEAAAKVPAKARLVIVGTGPLEDALLSQLANSPLGDRVVLAGAMDGMTAMAGFDVLVLSSIYEGFPYVLVEAVAMGLPIVTTDVGGAADIVQTGENGLIVPVGDSTALSVSLQSLLAHDGLRHRMAAKSQAKAEYFISDRMVHNTLRVYRGEVAPNRTAGERSDRMDVLVRSN